MTDILIIGGGPAGLTAALYACRANKSVLVLEKGAFGGQITYSPKVENIPGFASLSGNEFADKLVEQVMAQGADIEPQAVVQLLDEGDHKVAVTESGERFEGRAVILATGVKHRMLGLPREEEFVGNGISFCAVCDGAFYRGQDVAVIGGGNSALQEALLLSENCRRVTVVQNLAACTGEQRLVDALRERDNVEFLFHSTVTAFRGDGELTGLTLDVAGEERTLPVAGVFVAIGLVPENDAFAVFAALDTQGYFDADESCTTRTAGVFVAGDCRRKAVRQVTTAAADGAVAALAACRYLDN